MEEREASTEFPYKARVVRSASGRLLSSHFEYDPPAQKHGKGPKGKGGGKSASKGEAKLAALEKHLLSPWYSLEWNFHIERKENRLVYREEDGVEHPVLPQASESGKWHVSTPSGQLELRLSGGGGSAVLFCRRQKEDGSCCHAEARKKGNVFITEVHPNAVIVKNHGLIVGDAVTVAMTVDAGFPTDLTQGGCYYVRPLPGNPSGRLELYNSVESAAAERKRLESVCLELIADSAGALRLIRVHCRNHGFGEGWPVLLSGIVDKSKTEAKPWDQLNGEFIVADPTQDAFVLQDAGADSYYDGTACVAPSGRAFSFEALSAKVTSLHGRCCIQGKEGPGSYGKLIGVKRDFGGGTGMSQLLTSIEGVLAQKEMETINPEDVDMVTDEANASVKRVCPRCEQEIPVDLFDSHWSSHSSEILPNLYLGGDRNAWNDAEVTKRTRITHILNVAAAETSTEELLRYYFKEKEGITFKAYTGLPFQDSEGFNILASIDEAVQFVRQALDGDTSDSHRVLVHCVQGISRSASVVIAYLMGPPCNMSLKEAWEHVKARRDVARPNPAFIQQLAHLELRIRPDLQSATLTREDVWPPGETYLDLEKMGDAPLQ